MTNTFQTIYNDQPVEVKYVYEGEEVEDAWIISDIESFNIVRVFNMAVAHHSKTLSETEQFKLRKKL